ncbi:MAG: FliO/MopB family protein [Candidatus Sericytochromatia bacterium]|uniref:FliO/MopB family protein n=1 Tax=Candidatus Tanganyikabacteria bacterium TaxID=2961651 RepID=A0A937X6N0_9BACT|nr:FliO/MopB family protein [Candidatus Tanganyikabacteria bacterium]
MTPILAAVTEAATSWVAATPAPVTSVGGDFSLTQLFVNLVVVAGLLGLLAYGSLHFLRGRMALPIGLKARQIRVEDRLPIDPTRAILIVGVGQRRFLVGMTTSSFDPIAELDPAVEFQQALEAEVRS